MDTATPSPERLELSTMKLIPGGGGKIEHVTLSNDEVTIEPNFILTDTDRH